MNFFFFYLSKLGSEMRCRQSRGCFLPPIQQLFWGTNDTCLPPLQPAFEPPIQTKPTLYSVKHFTEVFLSFSGFITAAYFFLTKYIFLLSVLERSSSGQGKLLYFLVGLFKQQDLILRLATSSVCDTYYNRKQLAGNAF